MNRHLFIGDYEYKIFKGASWLKIYYQDLDVGKLNSINEARSCNEPGKYSILEEARNITHHGNDSYEFLLEYPGLVGFNRWLQSNYPLDAKNENVIGFVNISCTWTVEYWGGLGLSTNGCTLLDGSIRSTRWHYAIGMKYNCSSSYQSKFPGPGQARSKVYLWMRVPKIRGLFACSCNNYRHRIMISTSIFMLVCFSQ